MKDRKNDKRPRCPCCSCLVAANRNTFCAGCRSTAGDRPPARGECKHGQPIDTYT